MDPRDRADAALARARARGAFVVTPDDAVSPMDAKNTLQIPRAVVNALDTSRQDGDTTMVIAAGTARGQQSAQQPISPALLEETRTQPVQLPTQQDYRQHPEPEQAPVPRELDGMVPTVQQPANPRNSLSRRLEGN
jgi:hypothetical protein